MIIEKGDLAALRLAEARGWFATEGEIARAELGAAEYGERLKRLQSAGVIRGFKTALAVPPLLGGDWVWAAVLATARRDLGVANALAARLPFVSEIVLNASMPERLGPNLAVLFYSRDFDTEAQFIQSTAGLEYQEVHKVAEYSFPVAMPLSSDEKELVRYLIAHPDSDVAAVANGMSREAVWVRTKLDRLLWSETNRSGVLRVQLELNWSVVQNFGHFHFLLETGHRPEQLTRLVSADGFSLVMGGTPYRNRYVQVEADVWGVGRLMDLVTFLDQIEGIRVAGVLWNRAVVVNTKWVDGLL
jgi:DNA-binding Lrp family transcriptional regulator